MYLLNKPRRESSFMKLGSGWPISLSFLPRCSAFHMETFTTCKRCSCLFRPWAACQPSLQELAHTPVFTTKMRLMQGNTTIQQTNRCDPLRLGSKNQRYQSRPKRCALHGGSSIVIISLTGRKQHATTTNSCSAKPHAMLRRLPKLPRTKTTDHQLSQLYENLITMLCAGLVNFRTYMYIQLVHTVIKKKTMSPTRSGQGGGNHWTPVLLESFSRR